MSQVATIANASTEVCRSFRNYGKCQYGDKCKYEHSEGDVIPRPPKLANEPCRYYEENGQACSQGRFCPFYHGEADKGRVVPDICRRFRRGKCTGECNRIHAEVEPEEIRPLPCAKWVRTGECEDFEKNFCVYQHEEDKKSTDPNFFPAPSNNRVRRFRKKRDSSDESKSDSDSSPSNSDASNKAGGENSADGKRKKTRRTKRNKNKDSADSAAGSVEGNPEGEGEGASRAPRRRRNQRSNICYRFQTPEGCDRVECKFEHRKRSEKSDAESATPVTAE